METQDSDGANGTAASDELPPLLLQLILAQLVNEQGEEAFAEVAEALKTHSLLQSIDERNLTEEVC